MEINIQVSNTNQKQLLCHVSANVHRKVKVLSVMTDQTMSSFVESALKSHIKEIQKQLEEEDWD